MFCTIREERKRGLLTIIALVLPLALVLVVAAGCGGQESPASQPSGSMKGYELYSWQDGAGWHFALLPGTNRIKTYPEITSSGIQGVERIEARLRALPRGSQVFWTTRGIEGLSMPPGETIDRIKGYCATEGLDLSLD